MKYTPIDCALHDYLEIACSSKIKIAIEHDDGRRLTGYADNVFSQNKAEWITLVNEQEPIGPIRLDQIQRINSLQPNPHFKLIEFKPIGKNDMHEQYKIIVLRNNKAWCDIIINNNSTQSILKDISSRYPNSDGFTCQLYKKTGENRILSASEKGIKVLAIEDTYAAVTGSIINTPEAQALVKTAACLN